METSDETKAAPTSFDKKLKSASTVLLIVLWSTTAYALLKLPASVPIHYNASGQADNYGNKIALLLFPMLGTAIYIGISALSKHALFFNRTPKPTSEKIAIKHGTTILGMLLLSILIVFTLVVLFTYLTIADVKNGLGSWFLPFTVGLFLIPTIALIIKLLRAG